MANWEKISAQQAMADVRGNNAALILGYDEPEKWQKFQVPEATNFTEFEKHLSDYDKDREIIFYCN